MDALRIQGQRPLSGELEVSGSKNASLPIMTAALLANGVSTLHRVPGLADVKTLGKVLGHLGVEVGQEGSTLRLDATELSTHEAPYELVRTMRASILVLGPLLARLGKARVSLPGGCAIGARPIDQHLKGLRKLGATIEISHGYVEAHVNGRLKGATVIFDMPTVGGTENLLLAASLAEGTTILENAAREPEVVDLCHTLIGMGAKITGVGTATLSIEGVEALKPFDHHVVADRIEFGTFLVAGAMLGEKLLIKGGVAEHQTFLIDKLRGMGALIEETSEGLEVSRPKDSELRATDVETQPYPGFPTDMQAQLMAATSIAEGSSTFSETVFENRFMHVAELGRMGANIRVDGGKAIVRGVQELSGATVMATDLRASACLVLAALAAEGESVVRRIYHLDRGYESIEKKLSAAGAMIERFREEG